MNESAPSGKQAHGSSAPSSSATTHHPSSSESASRGRGGGGGRSGSSARGGGGRSSSGRGRGRSSNGRGGRGRGGGRNGSKSEDSNGTFNNNNNNDTNGNGTPNDNGSNQNGARNNNGNGSDNPNKGREDRIRGRGRGGRGRNNNNNNNNRRGGRGAKPPAEGDTATANGQQQQLSTEPTAAAAGFRDTNTTVPSTMTATAVPIVRHQPTLSLPTPPSVTARSGGKGIVILSRHSHPPVPVPAAVATEVEDVDHNAHAQELSERLASAALEDDDDDDDDNEPVIVAVSNTNHGVSNGYAAATDAVDQSKETIDTAATTAATFSTAASTPKKKKKPKKKREQPEPPPVVEEPEEVSTADALKALRGHEVSITASTQVKIRRNESSASLTVSDSTPSLIAPTKKGKARKTKGLSSDSAANNKAARRFNNEVRACVDRSDAEGMRDILHDRHNHNFALDAMVLETVMKAYVMAALFDDALYCLRNCTLPGTLSTGQTEHILTCLPQNLRNSSAYTAADMINALCIATEFDSPTSRTYFLRIVRGIALEFLEEATSARDRICSALCERLVRSAVCVVDARLKRGKKPTELIVMPGDQLGVFVPDTLENRGIQAGDAVSILPYAGPYPMSAESLDRNMIEATVTNTNPMVVRLQDKTNASLHAMLTEQVEGNVYRVDKLANRMGFNRQLTAAVAIASPIGDLKTRDSKRPCPELIRAITAMDENIEFVMKKGNMGNGQLTSTAALCAKAVPWNVDDETEEYDQDSIRSDSYLALEKYGAMEGLNASQRSAVEGATSNRLTLVQGPPGTGKTAVAIRILRHWARLATASLEKGENPSPILATSDSNIAVDNLVEGCAAAGLRVVRLGRPEAIRPELLRFCIDRPPSSYSNGKSGGGGNGGAGGYKERMKQLKNAQIICCTCIGSGGDILDSITFDRILVDEATQATEPAVLVPLMRGCRQLVLVGDHCQLPPTVLSTRAEEEGHGVPLFSRMVACGVPPFMLDTQYRMHPCIAMFPSDLFYGGLLKNGVSAPERRPLAGFPWPREEFPVAFVSVYGTEMDDGVSKLNEAEAAAACDAVTALLQGGQCTVSDIAVVTPYAAQARLIRRMTRRLTSGPPYVEVASVDGFQGREKEAVIFSAVRSNDYGAIGFTSDWRRINVSFTRARRALIVIGNDQTLRRGDPDTWMPWLAWADAYGINMDKPGVPRGRYEPEQLRRVRGGTTAAEMLKDVLARQQAQLKNAEHMQERAEKNSKGHIMASGGDGDDDDDGADGADQPFSLEEDLAMITNADGNWDDSDDEDQAALKHSVSRATLTSGASSNALGSNDDSTTVDVWDL